MGVGRASRSGPSDVHQAPDGAHQLVGLLISLDDAAPHALANVVVERVERDTCGAASTAWIWVADGLPPSRCPPARRFRSDAREGGGLLGKAALELDARAREGREAPPARRFQGLSGLRPPSFRSGEAGGPHLWRGRPSKRRLPPSESSPLRPSLLAGLLIGIAVMAATALRLVHSQGATPTSAANSTSRSVPSTRLPSRSCARKRRSSSGSARPSSPSTLTRIVARHFTDPGCPWAYSSRPAIARLRWRFGGQIEWRLILIGLSESTESYRQRGITPGRMAASILAAVSRDPRRRLT